MTLPLPRRASSSTTPSTPDVLKELFGTRPFPELLALLDPHVESLLWQVIRHIDVGTFREIQTAKRPSRQLVLHLRAHKDDLELNTGFRRAVEEHEELGKVIEEVKEEKERPQAQRKSSLPAAPTSSLLLESRELLRAPTLRCKPRTLPFAEIRRPDQWEDEVLAVLKDNAPPLVVTFCDPSDPLLPEEYVAEMSQLAHECRAEAGAKPLARFKKVAVAAVRERAESIIPEPITTFPTVLIILRSGFRRVDGLDIKRVRKRLLGRRRPSEASSPTSNDSSIESPPSAMPSIQPVLVEATMEPSSQEPIPPTAGVGETAVEPESKSSGHILVPLQHQTGSHDFLDPAVVLSWLPSFQAASA
ncbi:hypothetical protein EXIGLDRAFT_771137 [Exidia glandulosa HHB12029]|uniref:Uncharacterized protein n=1 Tax=Exidia glandulosa HHB12029 TaxID=1314781 RepID=A0A165G7U2_EXIGL|nr:hypothetical protein EXIGLDRAFT_771137 [Exidia glandulosa HHB12029]